MVNPYCQNGLCHLCPGGPCTHHCHIDATGQESLFGDLPVRPYRQAGKPSAGWSGTDTSRDAEPVRAASQRAVLAYVAAAGPDGATVAETREATGYHHGVTSGALSVLTQRGHLVMTERKRGRCRVYVLPRYAP